MNRLNSFVENVAQSLTESFRNVNAIRYFIKGLLVFALIKVIQVWPAAHATVAHQVFSVPGSWTGKMLFAPSLLARVNIHLFYGTVLCVLLLALFSRFNYLVGIVFFWMTLNLYRVSIAVGNGSDYALLIFSCWTIPLASAPVIRNARGRIIQYAIFNLSVLLVQLQVVFIYLISGWDKLISPAWRSGEAFAYVTHLDTMFNPALTAIFEGSMINLFCSWLTILFEIAFAVLVWFKRTRIFVLCAGVLFHLGIWIMLSLPDFALIMIISYLAFLKDSDYRFIPSVFKR